MAEESQVSLHEPTLEEAPLESELSTIAAMMKEIIVALVDHPNEIKIREFSGQMSTVLEVESAPSDLGKLVGRHGRTADALRTILVGFGGKAKRRFILELIEPNRK